MIGAPALAQPFDSGSDGSDGPFVVPPDGVIDLSLAATASWDAPSPVPGRGVYDSDRWVVVFKYTTINVPAGTSITFVNHPSGAPVVWLASGSIEIDGTVSVAGESGGNQTGYTRPGPGGFAGGAVADGKSGGFGPGGGAPGVENGGAGNGNYGSPHALPLIGGSGGGAGSSYRGGAGGGATLMASSQFIEVSGAIRATGGSGGWNGVSGSGRRSSGSGSHGMIRLVAPRIAGQGIVGFADLIRVEALDLADFSATVNGETTYGAPGILFAPSNAPALRLLSVAGRQAPTDPAAGVLTVETVVSQEVSDLLGSV